MRSRCSKSFTVTVRVPRTQDGKQAACICFCLRDNFETHDTRLLMEHQDTFLTLAMGRRHQNATTLQDQQLLLLQGRSCDASITSYSNIFKGGRRAGRRAEIQEHDNKPTLMRLIMAPFLPIRYPTSACGHSIMRLAWPLAGGGGAISGCPGGTA